MATLLKNANIDHHKIVFYALALRHPPQLTQEFLYPRHGR